MFKLFGFLNTTQQLNTKGIGLGLHICQKIVQQLGGDIICESQWGVGTAFTFVVALHSLQSSKHMEFRRCRNPIQKKYPLIVINEHFEPNHVSLTQRNHPSTRIDLMKPNLFNNGNIPEINNRNHTGNLVDLVNLL